MLRGDLNNITVGAMSNIQDRSVVHAARTSPTGLTAATLIGKYVTIEPGCVLRSVRGDLLQARYELQASTIELDFLAGRYINAGD